MKYSLAGLLAVCATASLAGGMTEPVAEPGVVDTATAGRAGFEHEKNGKNPRLPRIPAPSVASPEADEVTVASE